MSERPRMRPAHWVVLALALAPAYKVAEWALRPGPKKVTPQAVAAGAVLFNHEWKANDSLAKGDGLGPVFNARSCVECHNQGGPGGGGPGSKNVMVDGLIGGRHGTPLSGLAPLKTAKPEFQETLALLRPGLPHSPTTPLADLVDPAKPKRNDI